MTVYHYILDPSALVYGGVGKIKEWVATAQRQNQFQIVFYVPLYTLKELDFLKKVFNPLISANARESIRFIDEQISGVFDGFENEKDFIDFETYNQMKSQSTITDGPLTGKTPSPVTFILETENNVGPSWQIASGYRRSTPLVKDMPKPINGSSTQGQLGVDTQKKVIGVFGNNIPGTFNVSKQDKHQLNNVQVQTKDKAVVPIRLKYLIRSCIQKQYIENKRSPKIQWQVICEDATTAIWLKSFGLTVKSVNEITKEFDEYSGTATSKVLFDPVSGKLVESTETKKKMNAGTKKKKYRRNPRGGKPGHGNGKEVQQQGQENSKINGQTNTEVKPLESTSIEEIRSTEGVLWTA